MATNESGAGGNTYDGTAPTRAKPANETAVEQVKGKVDDAIGAAQQLYVRAAERAKDVVSEVDDLISDKPYISVGVGVAGGLLVGVLLGALIAGRD